MKKYRSIKDYSDCGVPLSQCKCESKKWEGWATTTHFGSGEDCWPKSVPNALNLNCINNSNVIGAAIPWRILCKDYKTRKNFLNQLSSILYDGKKDNDNLCYEIQPIRYLPYQLKQGSYDFLAFEGDIDINEENVVAMDIDGQPYPTYIIWPYEGCGGFCDNCNFPDCYNGCNGKLNYDEQIKFLNCDFTDFDKIDNCCQGPYIQWKNNFSSENKKEFEEKASCPFAIGNDGKFTSSSEKCDKNLNWCSGYNMHFDLAINGDKVPWLPQFIKPDPNKKPASQDSTISNIVVRYRRIQCPSMKCKRCS